MTLTYNPSTVTLELPAYLYTDLQARATQEHVNLVELLARLLKLARQDIAAPSQTDPVFELIGAYRSQQPLIDNIPASEAPDLYLALAASGDQFSGKHAWEIAPARYTQSVDGGSILK